MNAAALLAREPARASASRTTRALARFAELHRPALARLASRHPRLADLAISFPALLFALAVPRRRFAPEAAIARVIAGASLSELASIAGVPLWVRNLRPHLLKGPLPILPDSPAFRRQIANHLPTRNIHGVLWLQVIADAGRWGHDDLAIWYARHYGKRNETEIILKRWSIAAWAWHSRHLLRGIQHDRCGLVSRNLHDERDQRRFQVEVRGRFASPSEWARHDRLLGATSHC